VIALRSPKEIAAMRKAGLVVWHALALARSLVRPGVTTGEIDKAVERFFAAQGVQPLFKGVPGKVPYPAVTCISVNEEVVHGIPGPRKLKPGDIVSIDTGCRIGGWCGDAAATFILEPVPERVRLLVQVTRDVLRLAIRLLGEKSYWSEVAAEMERFVKQHGFSVVEAFVGHGIGRNMHEDPQVPNFVSDLLRRGGDFRIQPGLVIAVEPMVNMGSKRVRLMPDYWTQVTADGLPSAHFEHTIAVTGDGPVVLTAGPRGELDFEPSDPEEAKAISETANQLRVSRNEQSGQP